MMTFIALLAFIKNDIKLVYTDGYKIRYYPILADFIIYYKEQVFIINNKSNMQYLMCYIIQK